MLKVDLHPGQIEVANNPARFRVICAGRRWGKSVLSRMIVLKWATEVPGLYYIVSPTYRQAKSIHWREILKEVPRDWVLKKNEVELGITLKNGSVIELKGAENPDSLRGVSLNGLVIDEIASIKNWDWLWEECLRPTLTDNEAPAIFISTPKGYNHFYDLYELGQSGNVNYKSWRFTSYENKYLPKGEVDAAKEELPEDVFEQEYMADFRKHTGLIYKAFERETHVIEPFNIPHNWRVYRGFDFGSTNPTAVVWIAVDNDDNFFIVDEYYESGQTLDYHAGTINANPHSNRVSNSYGDPSGAQWIAEFNQRNIYITPATRETGSSQANWVRFGIDKIATRLKPIPGRFVDFAGLSKERAGYPSLFVFGHCKNTIAEFENYRWKEKSVTQAQDLNEPDQPEKANDHLMDALRYFVVSHKRLVSTKAPAQWSDDAWKIGR